MEFQLSDKEFVRMATPSRIRVLKNFIERSQDDIEQHNYQQVYSDLEDLVDDEDDWLLVPIFTELLLRSGIDPLQYFYKSIPDDCFRGVDGKKDFIIPDGVETIGRSAFCDLPDNCRIKIPASVDTIEGWAFAENKNLKIEHDVDSDDIKDITTLEYLFHGSTGTITYKNGYVETIEDIDF